MRIAVLGGTGCGGGAVVAALRRDHEVIAIARGRTGPAPDVTCDRNDIPGLRRVLAWFAPEVLVDHVAYRPEEVQATLGALPPSTRRYVFISSAVVYGPGRAAPYRVDETPRPAGPFATAKYAAEKKALAWDRGEVTRVRLGGLYGPGHAPFTPWGRAGDLVAKLHRGEILPIPSGETGRLQPWFSTDHGAAIAGLCAGGPRLMNLAGREQLTWPRALSLWAEAAGTPPPQFESLPPVEFSARADPSLAPFLAALLNPPVLEVAEDLPFTPAREGFGQVMRATG